MQDFVTSGVHASCAKPPWKIVTLLAEVAKWHGALLTDSSELRRGIKLLAVDIKMIGKTAAVIAAFVLNCSAMSSACKASLKKPYKLNS